VYSPFCLQIAKQNTGPNIRLHIRIYHGKLKWKPWLRYWRGVKFQQQTLVRPSDKATNFQYTVLYAAIFLKYDLQRSTYSFKRTRFVLLQRRQLLGKHLPICFKKSCWRLQFATTFGGIQRAVCSLEDITSVAALISSPQNFVHPYVLRSISCFAAIIFFLFI
jgi:hypothetical protein